MRVTQNAAELAAAPSADRDYHAQPRTDIAGGGYSARHAHHRRGRRRPGKQELATDLVVNADALLVDALTQCADIWRDRDGFIGKTG